VDYSTCPPSRGLKRSKAASVVVVARENKTEDKEEEDQEEHNRNAFSYRHCVINIAALLVRAPPGVSSHCEEFHRAEAYLIKTEERDFRDFREEVRAFSHLLVKHIITRSFFENV
jgi:hypothetical protein